MPVYAAISPTFSSTEATLEALNAASFYADSASMSKAKGMNKHRTTLARFEKIFVFMVDPKSSKWAALYSFLIATAAFASCFVLFLQTLDGPNHNSTVPDYPNLPKEDQYTASDTVFTSIFTIELLVRIIIWPSLWKEHEYLTERRLKPFLRDFYNWFDFAAIIPFYTDVIFTKDKSFVIMRLCRLLRIFKLARNHSGTFILVRAIRASLAPISIALIFFLEIVLFFSVIMYMVDTNTDRTKVGFSDLLTSGYFVVVTVTTIGYGDITPTKGNIYSRCFAVMIIMCGPLFLSMPLAIIGTEFDRAWREHTESVQKYQQQGQSMDAKSVQDTDTDQKHEILVKYNHPNKLYLRLAAMTSEASLMIQALVTESGSPEMSVTKLQEIADDLKQQVESCFLKCEELGALVTQMVVAQVEKVEETMTFKKWLHKTLSDKNSSRLAKYIWRWVTFCLVFSMIIVVFQTMPDLQTYGEKTELCEIQVKKYCENAYNVTPDNDPGCYRVDLPDEPLRFGCTAEDKIREPSCFGHGLNFGAADLFGLSCQNRSDIPLIGTSFESYGYAGNSVWNTTLARTNPFRSAEDLPSKHRKLAICKRWECDNLHVTFVEFGSFYPAIEYVFTITYIFELSAAIFTCSSYRTFFKNPVLYIEMASFIPFFVFEGRRFFQGVTPIYVIPPGSTDALTFLRLLRVFRIFKIQQSIPVTKVLWESISKTSTRLTIPYFMLVLVTTILSFIMYEIEKGQECFVGRPCAVNGKNITSYPADLAGSPDGRRFLINTKYQISSFDDFFSAFWFVIVTLATIGYGDMEPVSTSGKLVAVIAMLFGACYTAMPLTLVGSQFNKSYREHKRREALLRTKVEVSKPFEVSQSDLSLWGEFAGNNGFTAARQRLREDLNPILDQMAEEELIDDVKRLQVMDISAEVRDIIYNERLLIMAVGTIVNDLRKEGVRLAEQQTTALQSIN